MAGAFGERPGRNHPGRTEDTEVRLAFSSPAKGWLDASGKLAFTANAGRSWQVVRLDGTVESLVKEGRYRTTLATNSGATRPRLAVVGNEHES